MWWLWILIAVAGGTVGGLLTTLEARASYEKRFIALNSTTAWQMEMLERAREIIEQAKGRDDLGLLENPTLLDDWTTDYTEGRIHGL